MRRGPRSGAGELAGAGVGRRIQLAVGTGFALVLLVGGGFRVPGLEPLPGGVLVTSALGWAEGEARLRRVPVSVVVANLEELGAEELATLRRVRMRFPHVGVIALVSLATPELETATTEGLVAAVLDKPILLGRLEDAVSAALSRPPVP